MPTKEQARKIAIDFAASAALEIVMLKLASRLKQGPARPPRRPMRRLAAAMVSELVAQGAMEIWFQRRRMSSAIEHAAAVQSVAPRSTELTAPPSGRHAQIPSQRQPGPELVRELS